MKRLPICLLFAWILSLPIQAGEMMNRDPDVDADYTEGKAGDHSVSLFTIVVIAGVLIWLWQEANSKKKGEK